MDSWHLAFHMSMLGHAFTHHQPQNVALRGSQGQAHAEFVHKRVFSILLLHYSILSAVTGEIDAARVAGIMAAKNAQMASALAAPVSASGS